MNIVILTGAGISAESGISTFRDSNGLWEQYSVEDVATDVAWRKNPNLVNKFHNFYRRKLLNENIVPNAAHYALTKLQEAFNCTIVTQNVDLLHEAAGNKNVIHMHGRIDEVYCDTCKIIQTTMFDVTENTTCLCGSTKIRPNTVLFGEMPQHMYTIEQAIAQCHLFISIGTSGTVYPAAGFVRMAKEYGADTVELNLVRSETNRHFDDHRYGPATQTVPKYIDKLIESKS